MNQKRCGISQLEGAIKMKLLFPKCCDDDSEEKMSDT